MIRAARNGAPPRSELEDAPLVSVRARAGAAVYAVVALSLVVVLPVHQALQLLVWLAVSAIVIYLAAVAWLLATEARREDDGDLQRLWERMHLSEDHAVRDRLRRELESSLCGLSRRRQERWHAKGHSWPEE